MGTALLKQASSEEGVEAVGQQWGCVLELGSSCCLEFACAPGLHGQVHKVPDACIATDLRSRVHVHTFKRGGGGKCAKKITPA